MVHYRVRANSEVKAILKICRFLDTQGAKITIGAMRSRKLARREKAIDKIWNHFDCTRVISNYGYKPRRR